MSSDSNDSFDYMFKLIIIGDSGVGKSSILHRYSFNQFALDTKSTIGVEFGTSFMELDNKKIKVTVWDTAGQERFRSSTTAYYRGTLGAFIVYDITNYSSFKNAIKWLQELKANTNDEVIITLVGNKTDIRHLRAVTTSEAEALAKHHNLNFIETSACDSVNIKTAFQDLVKNIYTKLTLEKKIEPTHEDKRNQAPKSVKLTIRADSKEKLKQVNCCN